MRMCGRPGDIMQLRGSGSIPQPLPSPHLFECLQRKIERLYLVSDCCLFFSSRSVYPLSLLSLALSLSLRNRTLVLSTDKIH